MIDWTGIKELASEVVVGKDALHVYGAFFIQISAAAVLRTPIDRWAPWCVVLLLELCNEAADIYYGEEAHLQSWQLRGAGHDVINTMLLPTTLMLLCRFAPYLFSAVKPPEGEDEAAE